MSFEREQSHAHDHAGTDAADHDVDLAPGRKAASSQLAAPAQPITSALIQRKASRDGNGVAADANEQVARAASSSGSPLPGDLRARFEGSLGADLSSVRVHTGASSASAAQAVGAKAYTTGQDIHFAAGMYDPSSSAGQHLLAHEVAHTVQQRGGPSVRQNKLEVSAPHDHFEVEADRAADAMIRGMSAVVTGRTRVLSRKEEVISFEDDYLTASSQMRNDGDMAVEKLRQVPPSRAELGTTTADVHHAVDLISKIEGARGTLGMMQGREAAANKEGQDTYGPDFVPFNEGSKAIAHNTAVASQLNSFQKSASRQSFQHTFFAQSYRQLQEEFVRLKATVDVIKQQNLLVTGSDAKSDIEAEKKKNPLLADAIDNLKIAIADMQTTASSATAGIAAIASSAGITFEQVANETDAMKLPPPNFQDTEKQKIAQGEVAAINADLAAAKATIGTVKAVVETTFSLATGGTSAAGTAIANEALANLGKKAESFAAKKIDPHTDGLRNTKGAKTIAGKAKDKGVEGLEGALADWMTNYSGRIAAANGKVKLLRKHINEQYTEITAERVQILQAKLAGEIGKFALLLMQFEAKKAAVTDAAKKVQEQAKKEGKNGTNIGAAAQAEASVSNFLVQADTAEQLGRQEKEQGDAAQAKLKEVAGDYQMWSRAPAFPGGPAGMAETVPGPGQEAVYYLCNRASDADARGTFDFSGYEVQEGRIIFTVNEDDVDERSVVMKDRTDKQLEKIASWKAEASGFKAALDEALGIGASKIK